MLDCLLPQSTTINVFYSVRYKVTTNLIWTGWRRKTSKAKRKQTFKVQTAHSTKLSSLDLILILKCLNLASEVFKNTMPWITLLSDFQVFSVYVYLDFTILLFNNYTVISKANEI